MSKVLKKDQVKGGGWGWRYKVAIFDTYSSKESDIDDDDIEYALLQLGEIVMVLVEQIVAGP